MKFVNIVHVDKSNEINVVFIRLKINRSVKVIKIKESGKKMYKTFILTNKSEKQFTQIT